jgi:WD40 repeat protein
MRQHEIRSPYSGIVSRLLKQADESVKEQDPVVRIENFDILQAEGQLDEQYRKRLVERMPIVVEPIRREGPEEKMRRHIEAVTAVTVSVGAEPYVVSASEDRTVRVWRLHREEVKQPAGQPGGENKRARKEQWSGEELYRLEYPTVVRCLACTGPGADKNLLLTGSADGVGILWDLDQLGQGVKVNLSEQHRGTVYACAFSADGRWCATAGDDKSICIWKTVNDKGELSGELTHRLSGAHKGAVTSLAFSSRGLVSAGRDNRLALWEINNGKASLLREIDQRAGQVEQLGVAQAGENAGRPLVLFDQGSAMLVLDLGDWSWRGVVRNSSGAVNFTNFALFSPDGKMILTAGASDNRLQLWSNPYVHPRKRAVELRQFVWNEGASNCAAFDPKGRFVVTGTRDRHVLIWPLPSREELDEPEIVGVLRHVGQTLDASSRQVRIIVDVRGKSDRLLPGDKATLVIYPQ